MNRQDIIYIQPKLKTEKFHHIAYSYKIIIYNRKKTTTTNYIQNRFVCRTKTGKLLIEEKNIFKKNETIQAKKNDKR